MNHIELTAQVVERGALRYTPAGLPALDLRLSHTSELAHAGTKRRVELEIHATALGEALKKVEQLAVGSTACFHGFLAKQRNGRGVMLHIQDVAPDPTSPH